MITITSLVSLGDALRPITTHVSGISNLISGPESVVRQTQKGFLGRIEALEQELDDLRTQYERSVGDTELMQLLNNQLIKALANTSVSCVVVEGQYSVVLQELKEKAQNENLPFNPNDTVYGIMLISSVAAGKMALRAITGIVPTP